jgi:hypothetical protein
MWEREPSLAATVEEAWSRRVGVRDLGDICSSLRTVMGSLYDWRKQHFKPVSREIDRKGKKLEALLMLSDEESVRARQQLQRDMDELLYREELMWLQRSRVAWLREGDRNTRYFHRKASWRRKKNRILKLRREDGSWAEDPEEMGARTTSFFHQLYTREEDVDPSEIIELFIGHVTAEMNDTLCAPFSEKEISDALFQIGPLKAPGPDGMPSIFFKRFWSTVGDQVTKEVLKVLNGGAIPEDWNNTLVVLIPKTKKPKNLKELRPISLCNVVYKVVAKVITNRLKYILPNIIFA